MQPVLDGPVTARQLQQALGTGLGRGQAGDDISGLCAGFSAYLADALDARNLGGAGPVKVGDNLGADCNFANLDAAVLFFNGLRRLQIGGQDSMPYWGKGRRSFRR